MNKIGIISPYRGDTAGNLKYLHNYMRRLLLGGQTPLAGHAIFPQMLNDADPRERDVGMKAGQTLLLLCDEVHMLVDKGISAGMIQDARYCLERDIPVMLLSQLHAPVVILTKEILDALELLANCTTPAPAQDGGAE